MCEETLALILPYKVMWRSLLAYTQTMHAATFLFIDALYSRKLILACPVAI